MRSFFVSFVISVQLSILSIGIVNSFHLAKNFNENDLSLLLQFKNLTAVYKSLDFGLGYPDFNPPENLQNALARAATSDNYELNQYAPFRGHRRLLKVLANLFTKLLNRTLNPDENLVISVGAIGAIYGILQAHTFPGDEWIVFSPYFPAFDPAIRAANGVPRYIPLTSAKTSGNITSSDFEFNRKELANLFNHRTRGILLNTPHNPTGKIFNYDELTYIAELAKKWDCIVIFDEVYQFMIYNNQKHHRLATFPGMFERTITIGSAGKIFSATGYRVGWAYGPKELVNHVQLVDGFIYASVPTPTQEAVAVVIEEELKNYGKAESYIEKFRQESALNRNFMYEILRDAGMTPVFSESGYFTIARWKNMVNGVEFDEGIDENADYSFVRWMVKTCKIYAYPLSKFYKFQNDFHVEDNYIRFTMIKKWETLQRLNRLFIKWRSQRMSPYLN